ncbi:hypothetical protein HNP84_004506 [Thermocatellispora tengchongensis]|uniref:Transmembrane protein n=1 Tax=Thermocatellispora tengchongensis TaxID=1073253 RepID=A0A840P605_9ACTN|nr:hypothetical protein [Thermocatellispora tengchongensis]MBB5134772.1 hypothetical protein [Thermocatellispora tengchongensis]
MESDSAEGLALIAEARAAVADRLITPWWYHPLYGLLIAGCVLAFGLGSTVLKIGGVVLLVVGSAALTRLYRRLTGLWVSGLHAGPAGRWIGAWGAVTLSAAVAALGVGALTGLRWPVWCLAVVGFAASVVLGRGFDSALRAQLRAGA